MSFRMFAIAFEISGNFANAAPNSDSVYFHDNLTDTFVRFVSRFTLSTSLWNADFEYCQRVEKIS